MRLTIAEKRILAHPPSPGTWICQAKLGEPPLPCGTVNGENFDRCWLCQRPRPKQATLLWPAYVAACKRVGIDPELRKRWTPGEPANVEPRVVKQTRRKGSG